MATHILKTPMRIGDLNNGITVDTLDLVSVSINFQPDNKTASVSCMLRHPASGWIHTVTLSEHTGHVWDKNNRPVSKGVKADEMWAAIKAKFPDLEREILKLLQEHLPEGTIA